MVATLGDFIMPACAPILAFATLFGATAYGQTPETCSCLAGKSERQYNNGGGDRSPLTWQFDVYLKNKNDKNEATCYVRHVENHSVREVRDILWDVAGYRRDVLAPHAPRPWSC